MSDKPRRRWFRYSLRTLFVAVTVLCLWMGVESNRIQTQRRAVEMIENYRGTVAYRHQQPDIVKGSFNSAAELPAPRWLRGMVDDDFLTRVDLVMLQYGDPLSAEEWKLVGSLTSLEGLMVINQTVRDETLRQLRGLTHLKNLSIKGPELTDESLLAIARFRRLAVLEINYMQFPPPPRSPISDAGLAAIKNLRELEVLRLCRTQITNAGLVHLQGLAKLETLDLSGTLVTDAGMEQLASLPLVTVGLADTHVTPEGIQRLVELCPTIATVYADEIDPQTLVALGKRKPAAPPPTILILPAPVAIAP